MTTKLLTPFRLAAAGFCFAMFGLGGLLFYFPFGPALTLLYRDPVKRREAARRIVARWFSFFCGILRLVHTVEIRVVNPEALLRPGLLICPTHPSLVDVVCLLALLPHATTLVKASLKENFFTRAPIKFAGYLDNGMGAAAVDAAREELARGQSLVIFPEGTRTPLHANADIKLNRGAATLALSTNTPITPVRISANPRWLTKEVAWTHLPEKAMTLTIEVLPDIPVDGLLDRYNGRISLAARALTKTLRETLFGQSSSTGLSPKDRHAGPQARD